MAGFGPAPKPNKRRRNADTFAEPPVAPPPDAAGAPDLPAPERWLQATRDWWATWATSGQSVHFTAAVGGRPGHQCAKLPADGLRDEALNLR